MEVFQCKECGLHYTKEKDALECEAFCEQHHGCSMEISKRSVERQNTETDNS